MPGVMQPLHGPLRQIGCMRASIRVVSTVLSHRTCTVAAFAV